LARREGRPPRNLEPQRLARHARAAKGFATRRFGKATNREEGDSANLRRLRKPFASGIGF